MIGEEFGWMEIRLEALLKEKGISRNKFSHMADMSWQQVDHYCKNKFTRYDVLALCKFCTLLDCGIEELLVFHPADEESV